mmetsp:Transcript_19878/g.30501  ORF Transcript_19878/g.30501 Transcript_19878/m.30501 type:complete len:221 (-) Transcript_19878:705-1367(-)
MQVTSIDIPITSRKRRNFEQLTLRILQIVRCSLAALKHAPISPPRHPMMMNKNSSHTEKFEFSPLMELNSPNENKFSISACPHQLSRFFKLYKVPRVIMAQKKARQVNFVDQYDAPSSSENSTPPMGALKAEQTPAAAPQATKSRFSRSLRKSLYLLNDVSTPQHLVLPCEIPDATTAPECTIGPSFPTGKPAATLKITPATLHIKVRTRTTRGKSIPFK